MTALTVPLSKARLRSLGDHDLAYRALCLTLSGQPNVVAWSAFTPSDWQRLRKTVQAEGVAPLLYHALKASGWPNGLPAALRSSLTLAYYATAARNLLIYQELTRILAALTTADHRPPPVLSEAEGTADPNPKSQIPNPKSQVPTIILKGAALATTLYPTIALRPLSDVDLLVPKDRLSEAVARLKALGYTESTPEITPGLNALAGHHVHLQDSRDIRLAVELHWTLVGSNHDWRAPSLEWFWEQTEEWKMDGGEWKGENGRGKMESVFHSPSSNLQPPFSILHSPSSILQLTPTAHLLYLAAHLMLQHGGAQARLLWFYDIHLLIQRQANRIDWDELARRAWEFRWTPALHAALQATRDRFSTPLPHGFLDTLAATSDPEAWHLVRRKADPLQTRATQTWTAATSLDWRARLRLALALLLPSPAYVRWRYKPRRAWLWPLYYPYRWLDILREGLSTLWRIGKGKVENGEWIMDDGRGKMDGVRVEGGKGKTERGKGG